MHHSSAPDPELADHLGLGATGEFPEGKLTEVDEGELKFAVGYMKGKVVIDFGTPVSLDRPTSTSGQTARPPDPQALKSGD